MTVIELGRYLRIDDFRASLQNKFNIKQMPSKDQTLTRIAFEHFKNIIRISYPEPLSDWETIPKGTAARRLSQHLGASVNTIKTRIDEDYFRKNSNGDLYLKEVELLISHFVLLQNLESEGLINMARLIDRTTGKESDYYALLMNQKPALKVAKMDQRLLAALTVMKRNRDYFVKLIDDFEPKAEYYDYIDKL